jgi:NAD(P)H dehydrogenase (quinone)
MANMLVLYYSSWGHVERMAHAQAEGVAKVSGMSADVKRVPELVPAEVAKQYHYKLDQAAAVADPLELGNFEGIIFGAPTRFGNMCAQMRNFLDQTGPLWAKNALLGKVGSVFTCTQSQHGGQETTITSFHSTLLHHGMLVVGLPYTAPGIRTMQEVTGGTPYGASSITGHGDVSRMPTELELGMCRFQGEHVAGIVRDLVAGRARGAR